MSIFAKLDFSIIQQGMIIEFCPEFINHIRINEAQVDGNPMSDGGVRSDLRDGVFNLAPKFFENKDRAMPVAIDQVLALFDQLGLLDGG
jgi:hypothetical protein